MKKNKFSLLVIAVTLISSILSSSYLSAEEVSVLERVRKVENPELAELIKTAIDNYPRISTSGLVANSAETHQIEHENKIGLSKVIRTVTEKYAQIKLLDKKIELLEKKITPEKSSDIKPEFITAKVSLEFERLKCIAELREALNLIPWTPFGPKEIHELNSWIHLKVSDNTIRCFNINKPFSKDLSQNSSTESPVNSLEDAVEYITEVLKRSNALPIRITLSTTENKSVIAHDLRRKIQAVIKNANIEYETELAPDISIAKKRSDTLILQGHNIYENSMETHPYNIRNYLEAKKDEWQCKPHDRPKAIEINGTRRFENKAKELKQAIEKMVKELNLEDSITIKEIYYRDDD